ncbi:MAG: hypothetical protein QGI83_05500 [Candidatus Latescibacteria bacterium]|nr:hypothetical protein [Candidatus Latescibacterota bacterium]
MNPQARHDIVVSVHFTAIPNCTLDLWMYESGPYFSLPDVASAQWDDRIAFDLIEAEIEASGAVVLRYAFPGGLGFPLETTVTPFSQGVDIVARPLAKSTPVPDSVELPVPNLCVQAANAEGFSGDPQDYQEFIGRCFIYTEEGHLFLDSTARRKNTVYFPEDGPGTDPLKAQLYASSLRDVPPMSRMFGCGHSPDRFEAPVMGIVSKDGDNLVAVATKNADLMWLAYFSCIHNNPTWDPPNGPVDRRRLRTRVVLMQADYGGLLERVGML